jgi:hypothetical protein
VFSATGLSVDEATLKRSLGKPHFADECFNRFSGGQLHGMGSGKLNHALDGAAIRELVLR